MGIIALLICISLSIAIVFLFIFYWSMKSGQYDDTYTPSVRMLFEDKKTKEDPTEKSSRSSNSEKQKPVQLSILVHVLFLS
jgi:cbb3-type cytochrome oxidase maturation protein